MNTLSRINHDLTKFNPAELALAADGFLSLMQSESYSKETIETYRVSLQYLISESQGDLSTMSMLKIRQLLNVKLSPRTVNKYLSAYRMFFKFLVEHKIIAENYWDHVKGHKTDKRNSPHKALSDSEVMALIEASSHLGPHVELALTLIFSLGLRVSEFTAIQLRHITRDTLEVTGKGSKIRYLGISRETKDMLNSYLREYHDDSSNPDAYLGQSEKSESGRINQATVWRWFKSSAKIAKIDSDKVTCHVGRATAITKALDAGVAVRDVANFVGHNCIDTTMIYDSRRGTGSAHVALAISYKKKPN